MPKCVVKDVRSRFPNPPGIPYMGHKRRKTPTEDTLDLVSYRGPRSMVTVNMSVDSRSTDGRYLGRASVATRSIIRDDSVDVVPLWRSSYRPSEVAVG